MQPYLIAQSGQPGPRGASINAQGVNFSVYSETAETIYVCLFDEFDTEIERFALDGRDGPIHFGLIGGVGAGVRYGLRADGEYDPDRGLFFDPAKLLVDPYAKRLDRAFVRDPQLCLKRGEGEDTSHLVPKAIVVRDNGRKDLKAITTSPRLIYEMNVRAYTKRHPSIPEAERGTLSALMHDDVISHLKHIGVDFVQVMPVCAWIDEGHLGPLGLRNAWGYNPMNYFAPDPRLMPGGVKDMAELTDLYKGEGIGVIVDVVYNHTGESDVFGPVLAGRGLDNQTYYRHVQDGGSLALVNDTGTGNTLRCDHPEVQRLVIDSLRHWVLAGGVSGFRFDLAPILGRTDAGFSSQAELISAIKADDVLSQVHLIAEPWDPGPGGYQLGSFPDFYEHNDRYRDDVRSFWRGDGHKRGALASRLSGSEDIFGARSPEDGVNFIAVHDGFTLRDTVSYEQKHNEANGEDNRDGHGHNFSWNCGHEGETDDPTIRERRKGDIKALMATLLLSRGTPMIQMGDEFGRTQRGNNNAYAQDNDMTWVQWDERDEELLDFFAEASSFRRAHKALTQNRFLTGSKTLNHRDVIWLNAEGVEMVEADWHAFEGDVLGMHLTLDDDEVQVWFNRGHDEIVIPCPSPHTGSAWAAGLASQSAIRMEGHDLVLAARSVVALVVEN